MAIKHFHCVSNNYEFVPLFNNIQLTKQAECTTILICYFNFNLFLNFAIFSFYPYLTILVNIYM